MDCGRLDDSNFSWPSLYSPAYEVGFVGPAYRPGGRYLSHAEDVFKYTLYWTLIFHLPFNFVAGVYAFLNFVVPPRVREVGKAEEAVGEDVGEGGDREEGELVLLATIHPSAEAEAVPGPSSAYPPPTPSNQNTESEDKNPTLRTRKGRTNVLRSRYTFSLLILLAFLAYGVLSSVLGAAVLAWVIVGVYRAGGFCVSTWIPFLWAVIQSLIALLEIWPSIIDIA